MDFYRRIFPLRIAAARSACQRAIISSDGSRWGNARKRSRTLPPPHFSVSFVPSTTPNGGIGVLCASSTQNFWAVCQGWKGQSAGGAQRRPNAAERRSRKAATNACTSRFNPAEPVAPSLCVPAHQGPLRRLPSHLLCATRPFLPVLHQPSCLTYLKRIPVVKHKMQVSIATACGRCEFCFARGFGCMSRD